MAHWLAEPLEERALNVERDIEGEVAQVEGEVAGLESAAEGELKGAVGAVEWEARGIRRDVRKDWFRTAVVVGIAMVSILGALAAWRGSILSDDADRLDHVFLLQREQQRQAELLIQQKIDEELRQVLPYEQHYRMAQLLREEADAAQQRGDTSLALSLRQQAAQESDLAKARAVFFQVTFPGTAGNSNQPLQYDATAEIAKLMASSDDVQDVQPDGPGGTRALANQAHDRALTLVLLATLFVAALFFLTLAQFARRQTRRLFAYAGGGATVLALAGWAVVEITGFTLISHTPWGLGG